MLGNSDPTSVLRRSGWKMDWMCTHRKSWSRHKSYSSAGGTSGLWNDCVISSGGGSICMLWRIESLEEDGFKPVIAGEDGLDRGVGNGIVCGAGKCHRCCSSASVCGLDHSRCRSTCITGTGILITLLKPMKRALTMQLPIHRSKQN